MKPTFDDDELRPEGRALTTEDGVVLGRYVGGGQALPLIGTYALWPFETLHEHLVIIGKTGKGKTTTVWRILDELARKKRKAKFFFIDGKADAGIRQVFCQVMHSTGREVGVFPLQRFNAWPADDWRPIYDRLMGAIAFAETGPAAYYRNASKLALELACRLGGTPPSSMEDLLRRLKYGDLAGAFGDEEVEGLSREHVRATKMRFRSLKGDIGIALDGNWSYGDVGAGYFGLSPMVFKEGTGPIAKMLLAQLAYYVAYEKDPDTEVIVVIDEFASLADFAEIATFVEQARELGVTVILLSQTVAGMGDDTQRKRIINNAGLVLAHTTPEWEALSALIGTQLTPEISMRYGDDVGVVLDRLRQVEKPKVQATDLLALERGGVWALCGPDAMELAIDRPDESEYLPFKLPEQEELFPEKEDEEPSDEEKGKPPKYAGGTAHQRFRRSDLEPPSESGPQPGDSTPEDEQ